MNRIETLNSIKKNSKNIPFIEVYNRFALLWIGNSSLIDRQIDPAWENDGYNKVKLNAGSTVVSVKNGGRLNSDLAQKIKEVVLKREYLPKQNFVESVQYWDIIKAIDTAFDKFSPRPGDYRILMQLSCPELFKESKLTDSIISDDRTENKILKKWRMRNFGFDRYLFLDEVALYVDDLTKHMPL